MKQNLTRIGLAVAIALASAGIAAQESPQERQPVDSNGDGSISIDELRAARPQVTEERFAAMDTNGDGQLSRDEMRAAAPARRDGANRRERPNLDTNGDGKISLAEMQASRPNATSERFNALDSDHDGFLSRDEIASQRQRFDALDSDSSGGTSLDEIRSQRPNMTQEQFDRMDRNGDGQVDATELRRRGAGGGEGGAGAGRPGGARRGAQ